MAYTTINKSTDYFNTKTWTGTGDATTTVSGVGFQPDFTWIKNRNVGDDHALFDAVRGVEKVLFSNSSGAESTNTESLTAFNSDGFVTGNHRGTGGDAGNKMVSWNWKAGTTSIPSGSTTNPSAVSINTTAGFGIYKITAPSSGNYVLKHGLGATPKMVIVKRTNGNQKWMVWHHTFSNATDDYLQLNDNVAKATYSTCWGTMNSTDCTIATGGTLDTGGEHVIYVFTEKTGYSKFSSYVGTGSTSSTPFIYTGFKPQFVLTKGLSNADQWSLTDIPRDNDVGSGGNGTGARLTADSSSTESSNATWASIQKYSNGFSPQGNDGVTNGSGITYIYMAFGQSLVSSNNIPCTAR